MGLPVTERGGPPGGGGIGLPEELVGGWAGAEGGVAGGGGRGAGRRGRGTRGSRRGGRGCRRSRRCGCGSGRQPGPARREPVGSTGRGWPGREPAGHSGPGLPAPPERTGARRARGGAAGTCSDAGRLVTSRAPDRLTGGVDGGPAGGPSLPVGGGSGPVAGTVSGTGSVAGASRAAFLAGGLLGGAPSWPAEQAPRAGPGAAGPHGRPSSGRGRPGRPRWTTNGSSRPSPGTGRGRAPLCWSVRARERARRPGSSSATAVTALPSRRRCRYAHTTLYPRTSQNRTFRARFRQPVGPARVPPGSPPPDTARPDPATPGRTPSS